MSYLERLLTLEALSNFSETPREGTDKTAKTQPAGGSVGFGSNPLGDSQESRPGFVSYGSPDHGTRANFTPGSMDEIKTAAGDDWPELAADPVKLATFARLVVEQRQIEAGTRPARFASVASCHWCGPVWVPAHLEGQTLLGCRWCMNRERGRPIPRPDPDATY